MKKLQRLGSTDMHPVGKAAKAPRNRIQTRGKVRRSLELSSPPAASEGGANLAIRREAGGIAPFAT